MNTENQIITYDNKINTVQFKDFTATELDLLFSILSQMRDKGEEEVQLSFEELKSLSKYNLKKGFVDFAKDLEKTYDKLISLNVKIGTSRKWTKFVFFTRYSIDVDAQIIDIAVNHEFAPLINELTGNFTKLELDEVTSLKSAYSKSAYRLLKQYRASGRAKFKIEDFRRLMDIPETYSMGNISQQVLRPIMKELPPYFPKLRIDKVKGRGKDKRKVVRLDFYFEADSGVDTFGQRVFRDKGGTYYKKSIEDFTPEEIKKVYPKDPDIY